MVVPVIDKLLTGDIEWAFNAARAPVNDRVRDCLQWRMPVDVGFVRRKVSEMSN